jgi:acetyltransferase
MTYAIHQYPAALIDVVHLGGERVTIRPILPQDAPLEQAFVRALSQEARRTRFFTPLRELPPQMLARFTQVDYRDHLALVAQTFADGTETIVGDARYIVDDEGTADFAVAVADEWRGRGLGRLLLKRLECHAAASGVRQLHGDTLHDNTAMLHLARSVGFSVAPRGRGPGVLRIEKSLIAPPGFVPCYERGPAVYAA